MCIFHTHDDHLSQPLSQLHLPNLLLCCDAPQIFAWVIQIRSDHPLYHHTKQPLSNFSNSKNQQEQTTIYLDSNQQKKTTKYILIRKSTRVKKYPCTNFINEKF